MCFVSTPKINTSTPAVQYMHNTFLDGSVDGMGATIGRNSLVVGSTAPNAETATTGPSNPGVSMPSNPTNPAARGTASVNAALAGAAPAPVSAGGIFAGVPGIGTAAAK